METIVIEGSDLAPHHYDVIESDHFLDQTAAYDWYYNAFQNVNRKAMLRHLMTGEEFTAMDEDARVRKVVVYEKTQIRGMSVWTDDMRAWPLVSDEYFRAQYPHLHAAKKLYYIGFVGASPGHVDAFEALIGTMYPHVMDGVSFMDFCMFNVKFLNLPLRTEDMLRKLNSSIRIKEADAQVGMRYWFTDTQPDIK